MSSSPARRVLVIVNPAAGARRRRKFARVLSELRRLGCAVTVRATAARGDAEAMARAADPTAFDLVAAAGGDGTVNEIINGLAASKLPLALIPLGTANVLAHEVAIPRDPAGIAHAVAFGAARAVHVGVANGRRFAMMLGVGIDARIVAGIDPALKRYGGRLAYVVSGIRAVLAQPPLLYRVDIDGKGFMAAAAIVANGRFYGGRFVVAPGARLDTPSFQVVLMKRPGRRDVLRYGAALARGRLDRLPDVRIVEGRTLRIDGPAGEPAQADGDLTGALPLTVTVAPTTLFLVGAAQIVKYH